MLRISGLRSIEMFRWRSHHRAAQASPFNDQDKTRLGNQPHEN
jgi:hypothetical protein